MFVTLISNTLFFCNDGVHSQVNLWEIQADDVNPSAKLKEHESSRSVAEHFSHKQ